MKGRTMYSNPEPGTATLVTYHHRPRPTRLLNGPTVQGRRAGIAVPTMSAIA